MTGSNDLDRLLGVYLEDGPRRAPERPVDAAIAFARAHPRRRDPFLPLRPDVMGRRPAMFSPQLVWATLVLALTVGVVAVVAVGSRPTDNAPVVPPPTVPSAPPASPSPSPSASPTTFSVVLSDENVGISWPIEVVDSSGTLVDVAEQQSSLAEPVDRVAAIADPEDPRRVVLTWRPCPDGDPQRVTIDGTGLVWRVERPVCGGDTLGVNDLMITLTFSGPVASDDLDVQLVETPRQPASGNVPRTGTPPAG